MESTILDSTNFGLSPEQAERFCNWLIGMGGWAPVNPLEPPAIHRLMRIQNPDNKVGIPRHDLIVSPSDSPKDVLVRREFYPLFLAFHAYDQCQYKG